MGKKAVKNNTNKIKGFSIHFMPFSEIKELSISDRVKKILAIVLSNKVVIVQGRLRVEEEIRLIEDTMAMVDHVKSFKGIELAVIEPENSKSILYSIKQGIARTLIGNTGALTIIGPASIVKEIKRDPKKIEIFLG